MPELTIRPPRLGFRALTRQQKDRVAAMSTDERVAAMCAGHWTYAQCCHWAARWPHEVPLINGEFAFIAAFEAEAAESPLRLTVSEPVAALALAA